MEQRQMPMLSEARKPKTVAEELIGHCRHRLDAIRLCVQLSDLSHEAVCEKLGIDKGHWSRMMQGRAWFPDTKSVMLMELCGNLAPLQYEARAMGFKLIKCEEAEIEALRHRLAELEKAA